MTLAQQLAQPSVDWHALSPELVLTAAACAVLIADLFLPRESKWLAMPLSAAGIIASLAAVVSLIGEERTTLARSFEVNAFALLFKGLFCVIGLIVLAMSFNYFRSRRYYQGEYYFLMLCSLLGGFVMASARDLVTIFIALELISVPAIIMTALRKGDAKSNEAALKFFLFSVLSSGVMLYGMSLVYGATGEIQVDLIRRSIAGAADESLVVLSVFFVIVGFAFKVSAVPFHFWAPDTYEGAPVPVAAFLSVASKAAGFAGLLQIMFVAFLPQADFWAPIFAVLSFFTMTVGNLVALQQRQVVRLLAYSSIAQAGYMLLPFALAGVSAAVDDEAFSAAVLYILVYAVMNLGAFAVVLGVVRESPRGLISDFSGLGQRAPFPAVAMTLFLISLAGIPLTPGFWGKFFIFKAAIHAGGVGAWLAIAMVVNSVISLFYYIGIARAMFFEPLTEPVRPFRMPALVTAVTVLATAGVFAIGLFPDLFAHFPPLSTLSGR